jgi:hypothetical protein
VHTLLQRERERERDRERERERERVSASTTTVVTNCIVSTATRVHRHKEDRVEQGGVNQGRRTHIMNFFQSV